jgi:hypothetical protein
LILDDNVGSQQIWTVFGDNTGFDIQGTGSNTSQFHIDPAAPANSMVITSGGAVGLGTFAPVSFAALHIASPIAHPALRLETTSGAYSWDLRGGSAEFLVGDATVGTIPFRVVAGAPTNTLVLNNNGNVSLGAGLADINSKLDIRSTLTNGLLMKRPDANAHFMRVENTAGIFRAGVQGNGDAQFGALTAGKGLNLIAGGATKVLVNSSAQISFGSPPPAITNKALVHASGAHLTLAGVWTNASSRALKQDIEPITSEEARDTVRALQPVGYRYKSELDERYVGFIAEDVPELVATNDRKGLASMDITAVLTKVVQDQDRQLSDERQRNDQQQKRLDQQQQLLAALTERLMALEQHSDAASAPTP